MSPQQKATQLVDTYRAMLMNEDTECGNEILCTIIAKKSALISVEEMISVLPFTAIHRSLNEYAIQMHKYLEKVKDEIEKL